MSTECREVEQKARTLLLKDYQKYRPVLEKIVKTQLQARQKGLDAWEWYEAQLMPVTLRRLVEMGILKIALKTNKRTLYKLECVEAVESALRSIKSAADAAAAIEHSKTEIERILDDALSIIEGYDDYKRVIKAIVLSEKPVHALLVGSPASGKTLFLMALERLPGAYFAVGYRSTKAGLSELILETRPRYLLIDELDKMDQKDMSVLLNLMEEGKISVHLKGTHIEEKVETKVIATANKLSSLPKPVVSRFMPNILVFDGYTRDEYLRIVPKILSKLEGIPMDVARMIAERVSEFTLDVRAARNLARMAMAACSYAQGIDDRIACIESYVRILKKSHAKLRRLRL